MALLRFASNSFRTAIELDGKGIGEGITKWDKPRRGEIG